MHKTLSKPPLTYVLAQIKIGAILDIERYIPNLQGSIRKKFPIFNKIEAQNIEIRPKSPPVIYNILQWHFKDKESTLGIMLDNDTINIHTSKYEGFNEFMRQIKYIITEFNKQLKISIFTRIGLRYINIIDSNIDKNIQKSLLGFQIKEYGDQFLSKTETIQKTDNLYIKIRATHLGSNRIKSNLVPADLEATASNLTFEHYEIPKHKNIMLDIDSFYEENESCDFNLENIKTKIDKLHDNIYQVFSKAVTSHAKKEWS